MIGLFGYIRVNRPECKLREYEYYRGVYCGLCRALGRCTGQCSRMLLGYDFTFMALVRMALEGVSPTLVRSRCIAHPIRRRMMAKPAKGSDEERILSLCACASVLLSYHKLRDDIADEKGFRRFRARMLKPLVGGFRRRAKKPYDSLDRAIEEGLASLSRIEKSEICSLDVPAEAFGKILADVLSFGLSDGRARIAREIGFRVGKWIYLVDAADDYEEDLKKGRYNPLIKVYGAALDVEERKSLSEALTVELAEAERGFDLLDYPDASCRGVVENIIYLGMPSVAKATIERCDEKRRESNE